MIYFRKRKLMNRIYTEFNKALSEKNYVKTEILGKRYLKLSK